MPFLLYAAEKAAPMRRFVRVREVELAGSSGPIATIAHRHIRAGRTGWHATSREVVAAIPGTLPTHELVFDLKPKDSRAVSLYRLDELWGYSYDVYTPLALRLECLFSDHPVASPSNFKQQFTDESAASTMLAEFLYINGGTRRGGWTWGLSGKVNGALLWQEAYAYFTQAIDGTLDRRNV